jgi:uncharacterized membrane protein
MATTTAEVTELRIPRLGHVFFAAILIWLGVMGLGKGDFVPVWQQVPKWVPARVPLAYVLAVISLGSGLGLLWERTRPIAARVIVVAFALWLLVMRLPYLFFQKPLVLVAWSCGSTGVMLAAAWVLYVRFAGDRDFPRVGRVAGEAGIRAARTIYGLSLIPFGLAHFMYLNATTVLIPDWIPWHTGLAYATGAAFIAAGLAMIFGVLARWAAILSTLQFALFSIIVWMPRFAAGTLTEFQRGEFVVTWALSAAAWVMADSFRDATGATVRSPLTPAPP